MSDHQEQQVLEAAKVKAVDKLPKLWTALEIKQDQDAIKPLLGELDQRLHMNAIQCMMHAHKHGDTGPFRRLVIDIVEPKTNGYRRQGILAWMKDHSPMRLSGQVIKLSGQLANGDKAPWRIEEANATPFYLNRKYDEGIMTKPVYRDTFMSKINNAVREFKNAVANTQIVDGKPVPIDVKKPFYDGIQADKVQAAAESIEAQVVDLSSWKDSTAAARKAAMALKSAQAEMEAVA